MCVEDHIHEASPLFNLGDIHTVEKNSEVISFDFSIPSTGWPGGAASFTCGLTDRDFDCGYHYDEWLENINTGLSTPSEPEACISDLLNSYETEVCWSRNLALNGTFIDEEEPNRLEAQFVYSLVCMDGASCLLTQMQERCIYKINAVYSKTPE